jgi:hypothetical protein
MSLPTRELRVLTNDVNNPHYDRRRVRGDDSIPKIRAGARIVVVRWQEQNRQGDEFPMTNIEIVGRSTVFDRRAMVEALIAASEPASIESWEEHAMLQGLHGHGMNRRVLEHLYQDPALRPKLEAALKAVDEELEAA